MCERDFFRSRQRCDPQVSVDHSVTRSSHLRKDKCVSSASFRWQNRTVSGLFVSGFFHAKKNDIHENRWVNFAHGYRYTLRSTSSRPALWSGDDVWIWGMQWLMFGTDGHWHSRSAKPTRRGATAGLHGIRHQGRQQPGFGGSGNTWAIRDTLRMLKLLLSSTLWNILWEMTEMPGSDRRRKRCDVNCRLSSSPADHTRSVFLHISPRWSTSVLLLRSFLITRRADLYHGWVIISWMIM